MDVRPFEVTCEGLRIVGDMHFPERPVAPCVICSHGLFSSKDSPKFVGMAEAIAGAGLVAVRYDHRGCGGSAGRIEDTSVTGRLMDLQSVHDMACKDPRVSEAIGLMGSSMGGYISLLFAAHQPSVRAVCTLATPYQLRGGRKERFQEPGSPPLKETFYEDLPKHNLSEALPRVKRCLVLHGEKDELVAPWHAVKIHERLTPPKRICVFPGVDHRFTDQSARKEALRLASLWFSIYLS